MSRSTALESRIPILLIAVWSAGTALAQKSDVTVSLTGDDAMKFSRTSFSVKPGQKVRLALKHVGKLPKVAMGHNVVILNAGVDSTKFAAEALKYPKQDYIPTSKKKDILAHTKMIGGGDTTSIIFTAPKKAGKYTFLCTFPGHSVLMKGVMTVK